MLETTFVMENRDMNSGILKYFPLLRKLHVFLTNGEYATLILLYNQKTGWKKFVV